jgi:hypothetical protein
MTRKFSEPVNTKEGLLPVLPENAKFDVLTLLVRAISVPLMVGFALVPPITIFELPAVTEDTPPPPPPLPIFASKLLISNGTDQVFAPADVILILHDKIILIIIKWTEV